MSGVENIADLGTRSNSTVQDVQPGSVYQEGLEWLKLEEGSWLVKTAGGIQGEIPKELNIKIAEIKLLLELSCFWNSLREHVPMQR